ncbi:hypothetical protein PF010_g28464 [Phytophthora fragariae]|uniref:Uncharacterized protein n=1 Tax=Phytophthora fragariae TaxID=53985 RepID=A0A6A3PPA6_9STRA|nr:hypothetical protein PF010_g28464 [Phytophthora fragariae]KAE9064847.1 hypothetical protein PF006_g30592 [Phytophthora fragariae]KAE9168965.1 hypothetical protein PF004_g28342 [Phytophthora fragariae]KAE9279087.1 hypothetical protein PF008_g28455 [Phytophthora fragariae]
MLHQTHSCLVTTSPRPNVHFLTLTQLLHGLDGHLLSFLQPRVTLALLFVRLVALSALLPGHADPRTLPLRALPRLSPRRSHALHFVAFCDLVNHVRA